MRRRLVETIIYGLLDLKIYAGNVGAAELALNALNSVGNPLPPRIKGALGERVKDGSHRYQESGRQGSRRAPRPRLRHHDDLLRKILNASVTDD